MEMFGFTSRIVYESFQLKHVIQLMVLISCAWAEDNIPSFNVTCDSTGLNMKIAFSKPFSGIVYAKGYRYDPLCSITESFVLEGSLSLPLTACGTYVQETQHPWITNTVVIQQHPLIKTVNDLEKSIICSLPHPLENLWDSALLLDQIYESHSLPPTKSSLGIQMGPDTCHEDSVTIFDHSSTLLTIFKLPIGTIYKDVGIKSCIAHHSGILAENASLHQITNPEGCFTIDSENSGLKIIGTNDGLTAYVEIKDLKMESSDSFYLTCEVILCKTKCRCSEIDQPMEHTTSVISHKLTKRSTDNSPEIFSSKQYETRTRFLKSTVKALIDRIIEQRKQNDKPKMRKRLMRLDDSFLSDANSFGSHAVASAEIFSPAPVSTEFHNVEPRFVEDYDSANYPHENGLDKTHLDYNSIHENVTDDTHEEYDSHKEHDPDDTYQDYDSHHDYREEPSSTKISIVDSSMVVVTSRQKFKGNGTEVVSDEELQKNGSTASSDDVVLSVNEGTENAKTANSTAISVFPSEAEIDSDNHESCVPRMRFVIVIVVMGFSIGCLLLVCCGMALYIRKEKKRNRLNDFLLYSIGF